MDILMATHTMNIESSHDTAMNIMYILMGIMFIFDVAMLYAHVNMHRRVVALEAELASRK
jgi:hypothetical protein